MLGLHPLLSRELAVHKSTLLLLLLLSSFVLQWRLLSLAKPTAQALQEKHHFGLLEKNMPSPFVSTDFAFHSTNSITKLNSHSTCKSKAFFTAMPHSSSKTLCLNSAVGRRNQLARWTAVLLSDLCNYSRMSLLWARGHQSWFTGCQRQFCFVSPQKITGFWLRKVKGSFSLPI